MRIPKKQTGEAAASKLRPKNSAEVQWYQLRLQSLCAISPLSHASFESRNRLPAHPKSGMTKQPVVGNVASVVPTDS